MLGVSTPMWPFAHASEQAAGKMAKQSKMGNTWKWGSTTEAWLFLFRCCTRGPSRFFLFCWCLCISTVSGTGVYLLLVRSKSFLYSTFQQSMRQLCSAVDTWLLPHSHIYIDLYKNTPFFFLHNTYFTTGSKVKRVTQIASCKWLGFNIMSTQQGHLWKICIMITRHQ